MSYFILYLISISEGVQAFLGFSGLVITMASVLGIIRPTDGEYVKSKALPVTALIFGVLGMFLAALIPTKSDWYTILGGGALYEAATSEVAKDLGSDALDIIKLKVLKEKEKLSKGD